MSMRMVLAAVGLFATAGLSTAALAADPVQPDAAAVAPAAAAPSADWAGFYIGALLGYGWGEADSDTAGTVDIEGFEGGAYIGANYQWNQFVLGVEADALVSGADGGAGGIAAEQNWSASLRARAGITLDQFLLYGTGGVAAGGAELSDATSSDSNTHWGWTLGAGAEAMLKDNITARVEYRYTDYEGKTYTLDSGSGEADLQDHSVRAGVGLKF